MQNNDAAGLLARLRKIRRHPDWYLTLPIAHLLHAWAGRTEQPKEQVYAEARARLPKEPPGPVPVVSRQALEAVLRDMAPPGVPFTTAFLRTSDLKGRFGYREDRTWSPMLSRFQATFNDLPGRSVMVVALFSDVVADYYNETLADHVIAHVNDALGSDVAFQDFALVRLKMTAAAAGLGKLGRNSLFFHPEYGFHVKISVILFHADFDRYDPAPALEAPGDWRLPACLDCRKCVPACPVNAYDEFEMRKPISCERVISRDFFGHRRNKTCRACITSCPESTERLKEQYARGVPQRKFWDYDRQINFLSDLVYKPPFHAWLMQRFYFGAGIPGTERERQGTVRGQQAGRTNIEHARFERFNGWISSLRERAGAGASK